MIRDQYGRSYMTVSPPYIPASWAVPPPGTRFTTDEAKAGIECLTSIVKVVVGAWCEYLNRDDSRLRFMLMEL